jgi:hypothetical protein
MDKVKSKREKLYLRHCQLIWGAALCLWVVPGGCGCGCGGGNRETAEQTTSAEEVLSPSDSEGVASQNPSQETTPSTGGCQSDADCVRGECCHSRSCVTADKAPNCEEIACTLDCVPGTMDCGAGVCKCQEGSCAVEWTETSPNGLTPE